MALGKRGPTTFCILPGNPRAVRTCYEVFAKRILFRLAGRPCDSKELHLPLPDKIDRPQDVTSLTPATLKTEITGLRELHPPEPDAFAVIEESTTDLQCRGDVKVIVP